MTQKDYDGVLLMQLKNGDAQAFARLYTKYRTFLMILAEDMLHNEEEAQDVLQEFFLDFWDKKLYMKIDSSFQNRDGSSTLRNYMYASVKNRCLNKLVREKRFTDNIPDSPQYPVDPFERNELYRKLNHVLQLKVPPMSSRAFRLRYYDQKSHKEIADEMHTSIQTVKNQIGKAVKILRSYFSPLQTL